MGNDGGSIPKRRELVKEAAKNPTTSELKESLNELQSYLWSTDPINTKPLENNNIVSDCAGNLYNKEAVLEFLLPTDDVEQLAKNIEIQKNLNGNIKSLKDIVQLKFETDPESKHKWVCPISNKTLGPKVKSIYLVPCGHVFASIVLKELKEDKCIQCGESFESLNIIPILPTSEDDIKRLEIRITGLKEKGLSHSLKKLSNSKKRKKNTNKINEQDETKENENVNDKLKPTINNSATASLTAKVLQEQEERIKRQKKDQNQNISSLFSKDKDVSNKRNDFLTRGFSISNKPK